MLCQPMLHGVAVTSIDKMQWENGRRRTLVSSRLGRNEKIRHSSSGGRSTNLTLQRPPTRLQAGQLVAFSYMSAYEIWQSPQSQFQFKLLHMSSNAVT